MELYHFNTYLSIVAGFGFAFAVRSFSEKVNDFFEMDNYIDRIRILLYSSISGRMTTLNNLIPDNDPGDFAADTRIHFKKLESQFTGKVDKILHWIDNKLKYNNINLLSLLSAIYSLILIVIGIFLRDRSNDSFSEGMLEAVVYGSIAYALVIFYAFYRDQREKYNEAPLRNYWIFSLGFLFITLLIFHVLYNDNPNITIENSDADSLQEYFLTSIHKIIILFIPILHYSLYLLAMLVYSVIIPYKFWRARKSIDQSLVNIESSFPFKKPKISK
jgi:hypothetical protein